MSEPDIKSAPAAPEGPRSVPDAPDEFAHVPGGGARRPPYLALGAAALALFLVVRLYPDVRYALSGSAPRDLGDARALAGQPLDQLPLDRYVRLAGLPERESALVLDAKGSWSFTQFFRLRGTGGRVFVRRVPDPLPVALAEQDRFTGRLVRFSDLSFADSIKKHFANRVSATHFFRPPELLAALAGRQGPLRLTALGGDPVTLAPEATLHLDVARPGHYRVELPRARFTTRAQARAAVEERGGTVLDPAGDGEAAAGASHHRFEVAIPDTGRDQVLSRLGDLDRAVRLRPARDSLQAPVASLSAADGALTVAAPGGPARSIAADRLLAVRTRGQVQIPDDAVLLVEGERPRDGWKALVALAFLLAFAVVNLLGLRRPA